MEDFRKRLDDFCARLENLEKEINKSRDRHHDQWNNVQKIYFKQEEDIDEMRNTFIKFAGQYKSSVDVLIDDLKHIKSKSCETECNYPIKYKKHMIYWGIVIVIFNVLLTSSIVKVLSTKEDCYIKANSETMIYHGEDSQYYDLIEQDICLNSEMDAIKMGFRKPK